MSQPDTMYGSKREVLHKHASNSFMCVFKSSLKNAISDWVCVWPILWDVLVSPDIVRYRASRGSPKTKFRLKPVGTKSQL